VSFIQGSVNLISIFRRKILSLKEILGVSPNRTIAEGDYRCRFSQALTEIL
jgi:hypothetical protein